MLPLRSPVRRLPLPFSHFLSIANDCDSESFGTARLIQSAIREHHGLELSESFFPSAETEASLSAQIALRPRQADDRTFLGDGVADGWFDQIHGLIDQVAVAQWSPMRLNVGDAVNERLALERRNVDGPFAPRVIGVDCRVSPSVRSLEIVFTDDAGANHWLVLRGRLGDRPGWELDPRACGPTRGGGLNLVRVEEERNASGPRRAIEVAELRARASAARGDRLWLRTLFVSNAGRPVYEQTLKTLSEQDIRVPVFTSHGQPGDVSAIGLHHRFRDALDELITYRRPRSLAGGIRRAVRSHLSGSRWFRGDDPGSPFYAADLLRDYGIRFMRLYRDTHRGSFAPIDRLIRPVRVGGQRFYGFRGLMLPISGVPREPSTNRYLGRQLDNVLHRLPAQRPFLGGILYTHWGCYTDIGEREHPRPFDAAADRALAALAEACNGNEPWLWVAPVSRLLRFAQIVRGLRGNTRVRPRDGMVEIRSWTDEVTGERFTSPSAIADVPAVPIRVSRGQRSGVEWDGRALGLERRRCANGDEHFLLGGEQAVSHG